MQCSSSQLNWTSWVNSLECTFKTTLLPLLLLICHVIPSKCFTQQRDMWAFHYLALYDLRSEPLGVPIAQVASWDLNLLPEQAQLELDQNRPGESGGTGGSHCGHGWRSCGRMAWVRELLQKETQHIRQESADFSWVFWIKTDKNWWCSVPKKLIFLFKSSGISKNL